MSFQEMKVYHWLIESFTSWPSQRIIYWKQTKTCFILLQTWQCLIMTENRLVFCIYYIYVLNVKRKIWIMSIMVFIQSTPSQTRQNKLTGVRQESKETCRSFWVMQCLIYQGPPWNIMLQNTIYLIQNDTDSAIRDSSRSPNQERCHFALKDTRWAGACWCVLQKGANEGFTWPSTVLFILYAFTMIKQWFGVIEQHITLGTSCYLEL